MGPKQVKEYKELIHRMKYIRGHFIETLIQIETHMNRIIEKCLFSKDSEFKSAFSEKVLNSRAVPLTVKIGLFKEIVDRAGLLEEDEKREFFKSLETLKTERNKWAHGPIFYEQDRNLRFHPYLQYIDGKEKLSEQKLTEEYFEDLDKRLQTIDEKMKKILVKLELL